MTSDSGNRRGIADFVVVVLAIAAHTFVGTTNAVAAPPRAGPLPALGTDDHGAAAAPSVPPSEAAAADDELRSVVAVERGGRRLGAGAVLLGDGRILTALSIVGEREEVDVRYADGSTAPARVGHREPAWDLALLIPLSGRWKSGLQASESPVALTTPGLHLLIPSPVRGKKGIRVPAHFRGTVGARANAGDATADVLDIDLRGVSPTVGGPLVDESGKALGIFARVCRIVDGGACTPTVAVVPIRILRQFLARTPLNAVAPSPFLGIVGAPVAENGVHGVRVIAVAPSSSAEKVGLKTNTDIIVAVDETPVDSPEALAPLIANHAIGDSVRLRVYNGQKLRDVVVVLRAAQ